MFPLPIGILLKRGSIRVLLYIRPLTYKYEPALGVDSMTNISQYALGAKSAKH